MAKSNYIDFEHLVSRASSWTNSAVLWALRTSINKKINLIRNLDNWNILVSWKKFLPSLIISSHYLQLVLEQIVRIRWSNAFTRFLFKFLLPKITFCRKSHGICKTKSYLKIEKSDLKLETLRMGSLTKRLQQNTIFRHRIKA